MKNNLLEAFLLLIFVSCTSPNVTFTKEQVAEIKQTFSKEEITYFYETVFFRDPEIQKKPIESNLKAKKWNTDIYIKAFGDLSTENRKNLQETVRYLNTLKLPIKIYITERANYNVDLHFGNVKYIKKKIGGYVPENLGGMGTLAPSNDNFYHQGSVAINIKSSIDYTFYKCNRILEELTQLLGIPGDSYSHPNSIFYEGSKNYKHRMKMAPIDIKVLQLLYSNNIPPGLTRKEYLITFKDIIKSKKIVTEIDYKKFEEFIKGKKFSQKAIELFCLTAFSESNDIIKEPHIQKWDDNIDYFIHKNISKNDSLLIEQSITYLSQYIDNQKFAISKNENTNTNLGFWYNKKSGEINNIRVFGEDMLDYQIFQGVVLLIEKDFNIPRNYLRKKILIRQLLTVLGINYLPFNSKNHDSNVLWKINSEDSLLSATDKELLQIFFSKTLKTAMTQHEIIKIVKKHYNSDMINSLRMSKETLVKTK